MTRSRRIPWTWVELIVIGVPLMLIASEQIRSYRSLGTMRFLAHESQMRTYLDVVSSDVRQKYLSLADASLTIPFQAVQHQRLDEIRRQFVRSEEHTSELQSHLNLVC